MQRIVSADLAYRNYRDVGIAVLEANDQAIHCAFVDPVAAGLVGEPAPDILADFLVYLCSDLGANVLLLDGPQAWKDPNNGLQHSRLCERALHTPAKTGVPGVVKPGNYLPFVVFSIAVFDALTQRAWPRYGGANAHRVASVAVESFPMSAWKSLGFPILAAKAKCGPGELITRHQGLCSILPLHLERSPNHDELQALISGLAGLGIIGSSLVRAISTGIAPFELDGAWREGFIVNPARPA